MAFPTTGVLTNFTGSDEDPLSEGGLWAATTIRTAGATTARCRRVTNQAASPTSGTVVGESVWADAGLGADQECFATIAALPLGGTSGFAVYARLQQEGATGTVDAYNLSYNRTIGLRIFKLLNGTFSQVGSTTHAVTLAVGDSIGISCVGTTITAWLKPAAGSWSAVITETDANVTGAGKIGLSISQGDTTGVDDFGGGAIAVPSTARDIMLLLGAS